MVFGRGDIEDIKRGPRRRVIRTVYDTVFSSLALDDDLYYISPLREVEDDNGRVFGWDMTVQLGRYSMVKFCTYYEFERYILRCLEKDENRARNYDDMNKDRDMDGNIFRRIRSFEECEGEEWLNKFMDRYPSEKDRWWQKFQRRRLNEEDNRAWRKINGYRS